MHPNLSAMKTALRVLTAMTERRPPDPKDVETLRQYLPEWANLPPDELACEVIQKALKRRSTGAARGAS